VRSFRLRALREIELGLVTDLKSADESAVAVGRMLEEPLHEGHPMNIAGGKYVDFQLIRKFERYKRKWRYDGDLRFVLRVRTDGDSIDTDQLLDRLSSVEGHWRVLPAVSFPLRHSTRRLPCEKRRLGRGPAS
jgi:hypothetical protein